MVLSVSRRSGMALFSGRADVYSHQVRWVIAEKGVEADIIEVVPSAIPEDLAEINPYASVPTLVDRDLVLYEPGIIIDYLDERFPHPPLLPIDPVARARSRLTRFRIEKELYSKMAIILSGNGSKAATARKELIEDLVVLDPIFENSPFFMSDELSIVDCALVPLLWRLPQMKIELPPQAKALSDYAVRLFKRRSFRLSLTEAEKELRG